MSINESLFPASVWDGLSPTRPSRTINAEPDAEDWDQAVAEIIAVQTEINDGLDLENILGNGNTSGAFDILMADAQQYAFSDVGLARVGAGVARVSDGAAGLGDLQLTDIEIDGALNHDGLTVGFYGAAPSTILDVTGAHGANAALISLIGHLVTIGLFTDSTS